MHVLFSNKSMEALLATYTSAVEKSIASHIKTECNYASKITVYIGEAMQNNWCSNVPEAATSIFTTCRYNVCVTYTSKHCVCHTVNISIYTCRSKNVFCGNHVSRVNEKSLNKVTITCDISSLLATLPHIKVVGSPC